MGYTTEFEGEIVIDPPLNPAEVEYVNRFGETRRMDRAKGPYYANPGNDGFGQDPEDDIRDYNRPPVGQPGLWCKWEVSGDGSSLYWSGAEKFYDAEEWMQYLIDHFFKPGAVASNLVEDPCPTCGHAEAIDPQFADFTFDHVLNGEIDAQGEEAEDRWKLIVTDNVVTRKNAKLVWE